MRQIKLLDSHTINQIAAGEVVERPASVIKELIENSIDAGATSLTVEIEQGGISFIRVTDNGSGIPKEQVHKAFMRHATSKIETAGELLAVGTLGFRGEALASIASVADVLMVTKTKEDATGIWLQLEEGQVAGEREIGCPNGTSVTVKNLFEKVPARKKFLKKPAVESAYITDMIQKIALGHPEIAIQYTNNKSVLLHTSGNNKMETACYHVYGKEISAKMTPFQYTEKDFSLHGLLGLPELARANRNYENLFIGGRFIKNGLFSKAVEDAYKTRIMGGKFPVFILHFKGPEGFIDVNVHPAKMEVRFKDEDKVYDFVYGGILDFFKKQNLIPQKEWGEEKKPKERPVPYEQEKLPLQHSKPVQKKEITPPAAFLNDSPEIPSSGPELKSPVLESINPYSIKADNTYREKTTDETAFGNRVKPVVDSKTPEAEADKYKVAEPSNPYYKKDEAAPKSFTLVGQAFQTYWIVEQENNLYIVDQHAAHERILYEEILYRMKTAQTVSQMLLTPVVVSISAKEKILLKKNGPLFEKAGFVLEPFGDHSYAIRAVPYIFNQPADARFFRDLLDLLEEEKFTDAFDAQLDHIATMACKAAVKGNDAMSEREAKELIERLFEMENPFTCPHGRPTIIAMDKYQIEKKFKRKL